MKFSLHQEQPRGEAIIEEIRPGVQDSSDTAVMRKAGAEPVYWVRSTPEALGERVREVLALVGERTVVVEGNSILHFLQPDYAIFIMKPTFDDFKESAWEALRRADTILVNGNEPIGGELALYLEKKCKQLNPRARLVFAVERGREEAYAIILSRVIGRLGGEDFMQQIDPRIVEELKKRSEEGRIACAVALKLAEELKVSTQEIGKAANELKIKITNCSLGCF